MEAILRPCTTSIISGIVYCFGSQYIYISDSIWWFGLCDISDACVGVVADRHYNILIYMYVCMYVCMYECMQWSCVVIPCHM